MKTKEMETKFKSTLPLTWRLLSSVLCLGAVTLSDSSARAQNLFAIGWDGSSGVIYEYTPQGVRSTFASGLTDPAGLAFDRAGNLFVADLTVDSSGVVTSGSIYKFTPDGVRSTFALGLFYPTSLAFDSAGNLFVADSSDVAAIYKFTPDGVRSTFATGVAGDLAVDSAGNLFVADGDSGSILKFTPDGVRSTFKMVTDLLFLAIDSKDNLYVTVDGWWSYSNKIYKITSHGNLSVFADNLLFPEAMAFDSAGNLFVSIDGLTDYPCYILKISPGGQQTTVAPDFVGVLAVQPTETSSSASTPNVTVNVSASRINQGAYATFAILTSIINPSQVTTVHYAMSGNARAGINYTLSGVFGEADIPAGASSTTVTLQALNAPMRGKSAKATMTIMSGADYTLSNPKKATITIAK